MKPIRRILQSEIIRLPLGCLAALTGGYLLSSGTVCGVVSPLAAALAGICSPLYAFCILAGSMLSYAMHGAPAEMLFLLAALAGTASLRILFCEAERPQLLGFLTTIGCSIGAFITDMFLADSAGFLPLYIMESLLTGIAACFLADAWNAFCTEKKITLTAGKSFTFAIVYLLSITALCGLDLSFCNAGRTAGIILTLLAAKQFGQQGGTLMGALTACGSTLCSVSLGMPLLFLPITGMLAGFLKHLPNALFIPVFFLMQMLCSAVLDSSMELAKILTELLFACCIYALFSHAPIYRILTFQTAKPMNGQCVIQREQFLSGSISALREETAEVMLRLKPERPADTVHCAREQLCEGCKNESFCWENRRSQTEDAFRQLLHHPNANPGPEAMAGCIRRARIAEAFRSCSQKAALAQSSNVHLSQCRNMLMEYFRLLEEVTIDAARQREVRICAQETTGLQEMLRQCRCEYHSCFVHRLKSGRYAAEIYAGSDIPANETIARLLTDLLHVEMQSIPPQQNGKSFRFCFFQKPPYSMEFSSRTVRAGGYARCGDTSDSFQDADGNRYLVLSDGMGSGSAASLMSHITVRTFTRLVSSGMPPETAIRFVNTMLMAESNTESFATLDILRLHADTGEVRLYKSGAASTLFFHCGKVTCIQSGSFPIGIVPQAEPFIRDVAAFGEDKFIMLSDGVHEAQLPYIQELLRQNLPLDDTAEQICAKSHIFHAGKNEDDISVIAVKVNCASLVQPQRITVSA